MRNKQRRAWKNAITRFALPALAAVADDDDDDDDTDEVDDDKLPPPAPLPSPPPPAAALASDVAAAAVLSSAGDSASCSGGSTSNSAANVECAIVRAVRRVNSCTREMRYSMRAYIRTCNASAVSGPLGSSAATAPRTRSLSPMLRVRRSLASLVADAPLVVDDDADVVEGMCTGADDVSVFRSPPRGEGAGVPADALHNADTASIAAGASAYRARERPSKKQFTKRTNDSGTMVVPSMACRSTIIVERTTTTTPPNVPAHCRRA